MKGAYNTLAVVEKELRNVTVVFDKSGHSMRIPKGTKQLLGSALAEAGFRGVVKVKVGEKVRGDGRFKNQVCLEKVQGNKVAVSCQPGDNGTRLEYWVVAGQDLCDALVDLLKVPFNPDTASKLQGGVENQEPQAVDGFEAEILAPVAVENSLLPYIEGDEALFITLSCLAEIGQSFNLNAAATAIKQYHELGHTMEDIHSVIIKKLVDDGWVEIPTMSDAFADNYCLSEKSLGLIEGLKEIAGVTVSVISSIPPESKGLAALAELEAQVKKDSEEAELLNLELAEVRTEIELLTARLQEKQAQKDKLETSLADPDCQERLVRLEKIYQSLGLG